MKIDQLIRVKEGVGEICRLPYNKEGTMDAVMLPHGAIIIDRSDKRNTQVRLMENRQPGKPTHAEITTKDGVEEVIDRFKKYMSIRDMTTSDFLGNVMVFPDRVPIGTIRRSPEGYWYGRRFGAAEEYIRDRGSEVIDDLVLSLVDSEAIEK